jgi:hypothetical protein
MTVAEIVSHDARWKEYPGEDWSDALVQSMKLGGIDHLFFVSGSEIAFWQESIAKANVRGWLAPKAVALNGRWGAPWCAINRLASYRCVKFFESSEVTCEKHS